MGKLIDLTRERFGRLVVIRQVDKGNCNRTRWLCICDCGKEVVIIGHSLKSGHTKSCGCLRKEITRERFTKHGYDRLNRRTRIYQIWNDMIQRCTNSNTENYSRYGGRSITVCKRWLKFENFLEDMGERPPNRTLERINNNKGYYKENCRWATQKEQARNRRNNHLIIYNGITQCIAAWAEELNINQHTLANRIFRYGWSIEKAFTTLVRKVKNEKR